MKSAGRIGLALAGLLAALCLAVIGIPPFLDRIYYRGPASAHYDGARFFNPDGEDTFRPPSGRGSRSSFIVRRLTQSGAAAWPDKVPVVPPVIAQRVDGDRMVATWVGHATVLVQTAGLNILTDPVWSDRSGPLGIGPKRVAPPGIAFDRLPRIDLVVVSHNHYDHMDLDTIRRLWDRDRPLIVTSLGNDTLLRRTGAKSVALDWGQRTTLRPGVDIVVTRNHHWSSRWFTDRNRALWSSFVVTLPGGNLFFAGDTGMGDGKWSAEAARLGPVRLALIPIGAFRFERGQMATGAHIGPILAERVFAGLGASFAIPIHWGTFKLSDEARDTPPRMLAEVMKCTGYADTSVFAAVAIGKPVNIPAYAAPRIPPPPDPRCLADPAITTLK